MKVYGPYFDKSVGRRRVTIYDEVTGRRTKKNYARYIMEQHLGRTLESWEHVDHINEDKTDDRIENLRVTTNSENVSKSQRFRNPKEWYDFTCPECGKEARVKYWKYKRDQLNKGMDGPYCSQTCSNKACNPKKWYDFVCPECGKEARREYWKIRHSQLVEGYDGPYCSKSCSAKARERKRRATLG